MDALCKSNVDGLRINPSSRLAVQANCLNQAECDRCPNMKYRWEMFRKGLNDAWIKLKNEEFIPHTSGKTKTEGRGNKKKIEAPTRTEQQINAGDKILWSILHYS